MKMMRTAAACYEGIGDSRTNVPALTKRLILSEKMRYFRTECGG